MVKANFSSLQEDKQINIVDLALSMTYKSPTCKILNYEANTNIRIY